MTSKHNHGERHIFTCHCEGAKRPKQSHRKEITTAGFGPPRDDPKGEQTAS